MNREDPGHELHERQHQDRANNDDRVDLLAHVAFHQLVAVERGDRDQRVKDRVNAVGEKNGQNGRDRTDDRTQQRADKRQHVKAFVFVLVGFLQRLDVVALDAGAVGIDIARSDQRHRVAS